MRTVMNQRIYNSALIPQRLVLSLALGAMLFALCVPAWAQQTGKVFRIGFLDRSTSSVARFTWTRSGRR